MAYLTTSGKICSIWDSVQRPVRAGLGVETEPVALFARGRTTRVCRPWDAAIVVGIVFHVLTVRLAWTGV